MFHVKQFLFLPVFHVEQSCGLRRRFRRALKEDRVRAVGMMFHVKQFLFLPVFHGEQSCGLLHQTGCRTSRFTLTLSF